MSLANDAGPGHEHRRVPLVDFGAVFPALNFRGHARAAGTGTAQEENETHICLSVGRLPLFVPCLELLCEPVRLVD
jgi:hypothetical protein